MAKCSNCGAELAEGQLFCGECGTKVPVYKPREKTFIEKLRDGDEKGMCCGTLDNREKFCPQCGRKTIYKYLNDADSGDPEALTYIGAYQYCRAPNEEMIEWYDKAINRGSIDALALKGYLTADLTIGDDHDYAISLIQKAFEKGSVIGACIWTGDPAKYIGNFYEAERIAKNFQTSWNLNEQYYSKLCELAHVQTLPEVIIYLIDRNQSAFF